ncbi:MAG TPA: NAD(P)/FAD-dependent oxidoreductase [Chthoniobacterales bacterium]|nr:NAD(P)/FAD-dependent oxidoreductase [Chthoniobacterales bacterium]
MEANVAPTESPSRVVIVGAGFAGLYAAKELADKGVQVTVVDRTNHHLFQPLLYQVATAGLSPADIAQPVRHILKEAKNIEVVMAEVDRIDVNAKQVHTTTGVVFSYDYLIVAAGARHSYFGHDEWERFAPGLKNLEDALELRRRILNAFEAAEVANSDEDRRAALTFVVVGGGPTGVEMAGAVAELACRTLADDFRRIDPRAARVLLVEGVARILPAFREDLSRSAQRQLESMGIEVRTGAMVKDMTNRGVTVDGEFIPTWTVVWAAGNAASPIGKSLGAEMDRAGRVVVNEDLTVPGHPEIFAIGDMACFKYQTGQPLPALSPVAMQMGRHAAKSILSHLQDQKPAPFRYFDKGTMATIGRNRAVADLKFIRFGGYLAWLSWLFVHLIFLVGLRNRLLVLFQWTWAYFTFGRGARLIYGTFKPQIDRAREKEEKPAARS